MTNYKHLKLVTALLVPVLASNFTIVHAATTCVDSGADARYIDPAAMLCPIFKIANGAMLLGGVVFAAMIAVGAIRLAVSMGDPKGLEAASKTWTFALIGVMVVLGALAILKILSTMFGFNLLTTGDMYANVIEGVHTFLEEMEIFVK